MLKVINCENDELCRKELPWCTWAKLRCDFYTTCTRLVHDVLHDGFLAEDDGLKMVDCLLQVPAAVRKTNELCIKNE